MKPKTIGIVGGAGPMAGVLLLERIFALCGSVYGCSRDGDFPEVILLSYPFSDMLTSKMDAAQVRKELAECLDQLRNNGASVLAVACNTLHSFLDDEADLIHLPGATAEAIPPGEVPLVLCTSTSVRLGLHKRYFPCVYPEEKTQVEVDRIIDLILRGKAGSEELLALIRRQRANTIILGCTELSLAKHELEPNSRVIIDPLEIAAIKILEKTFKQ